MKYLLSVLLFFGFIFFSIPCFADVTNNDASFNLQDSAARVAGQALIPEIIRQDASDQASLALKTEVGVKTDFLKAIQTAICAVAQMFGLNYCLVDLSVGEDTAQYTARSKILGQSAIPTGMELIPANKDPDLGYPGKEDTGNDKLNQLSENLGTTTGFFKSNEVFLSDYDNCVNDRMKNYNFNLNGARFKEDHRSADIYCSKQVFCKGNYPNGICPFEPTP